MGQLVLRPELRQWLMRQLRSGDLHKLQARRMSIPLHQKNVMTSSCMPMIVTAMRAQLAPAKGQVLEVQPQLRIRCQPVLQRSIARISAATMPFVPVTNTPHHRLNALSGKAQLQDRAL